MKKVLLVFDGQHFSKGAFDFACRLNESHPILLTGLFLPSTDYTSMIVYYLGMENPIYAPFPDSETEIINENIEKFKALCEKNHIEYRVHDGSEGSILNTIQKETRYSDLLLLSSELFYSNLGSYTQKEYIRDTTHNAECPVVLVPEQMHYPRSIVLAYDGSESSVFSIKQFAYLFPELTSMSTIMVYASEKKREMPDFEYIKEFAARHFPTLSFVKPDTDPRQYFSSRMHGAGPTLLVSGAYGRSLMSEMFKKSFIQEIIKEHKLPVFVAHQ